MPPEQPSVPTVDKPITDLTDQRVVQILSTEHWSLLGARSLAYNEAFTRGGMFLTFLSASLVALALLAQGMSFGEQFLTVAAIVLGFDFVIGLTTYFRILGANVDDLRAAHGMARIRHSYVQIAPITEAYFTTPIHDDIPSVLLTYGSPSTSWYADLLYGLTTSGGMIGLIVSMVGGVLVGVLALMVVAAEPAVWIGLAAAVVTFVLLVTLTFRSVPRQQAGLTVRFPAPPQAGAAAPER